MRVSTALAGSASLGRASHLAAPLDSVAGLGVPGVVIRAIAPTDAPALERFYAALSERSRTRRFLGFRPALGADGSRRFCSADHEHREGFVAVLEGEALGRTCSAAEIVGHLCLEPDVSGSAELAIAVADRLQGMGIGRSLIAAGLAWAARAGLQRLTATASATNGPLFRLILGLGLRVQVDGAGGISELSMQLPGRQAWGSPDGAARASL